MASTLGLPSLPLPTLTELALLFAALVLGVVCRWIVVTGLRRAVQLLPERSLRRATFRAADGPGGWAALLVFGAAGLWLFARHEQAGRLSHVDLEGLRYFAVLALPLGIWFTLRWIDGVSELWAHRAASTESTFDDQLVPIVRASAKGGAVIVGGIAILQMLSYPVGSLVAGFGIGGMAVALAAKDTLANLFGSLVIFIDRPFQVGDWVEIGDREGTIERVGLRVTRIRTFANSLITVPNGALTTSAVNNWSRMNKRRIKLTLGLTYSTSAEQLKSIVTAIRQLLREHPGIDQDYYLVNFTNFGNSALELFVYCFTSDTVWANYLEVRQELLLQIMEVVEKQGSSFAFPTQSLHIESHAGRPAELQPPQ